MANSFLVWVSVIGGVVTIVVAILTAFKVVPEAKNLRRRDVKDLLDLIDEAGNRFEKESANAWRNPDAKPPKGSFEDSLGKDLLVSQIFGRTITHRLDRDPKIPNGSRKRPLWPLFAQH